MERRPVPSRSRSVRLLDALRRACALAAQAGFHLRRSPGLAGLSLVMGVALWVIVSEAENPTRVDRFTSAIPLEAVNVSPGYAVANQLSPVAVRIAAPEDRWDELTAASFRAFVDLNGREAREQFVPVRIEVVGARGVRVLEALPASVVVHLEELVTKQVPVSTRQLGTLPRGHELSAATPERRSVEVSGAASLVALVSEAVASINLTGLTVGLEDRVALVPVAEGGGEVRGVSVRPPTVRVTIGITLTALTRTLPLQAQVTGQPAPGYRIAGVRVSPTTAAVDGTIDVLQALDTLRLPPVDIGGQQGDVRSTLRPVLPPGLAAPGLVTVAVEVQIVPIVGSLAITVAPEVLNVRTGFQARAAPGAVVIALEGPLARLNALAPGAVRATADAYGLGAGTAELRLAVQLPDGIDVREVQPASVSVTLTRP
ncbi:MAG: hypothetical protein FJ035_03405 [Chloroflexi bacterium]|nr:hypothetical protein [Chloroflexota bacterium]